MPNHVLPYDILLASVQQLRDYTWRFTLSPHLWANLDLPQKLHWHPVPFDQTPSNQVPNDSRGVYAFVLEPNVGNLPLAYLLYVGMTERNFRKRFGEYKRHQREEKTKRPLVKEMLTTWPERITFYYAPIDDMASIQPTEDQLIAAFKPPICRKYPASVRQSFRMFDERS